MSCDFGVWFPHRRLSDKQAGELYTRLCQSDTGGVQPHSAVDAFYAELTSRHPEIDTIPENRVGDFDYCPWSCEIDRSPGHLIMACVWSKAGYVRSLVHELALKHGLAVYDPQSGRITNPDSASPPAESPWWRFW